MQIDQARIRYIRWLLATRDLSPHTIRAYGGDLTSFERYMGADFALVAASRRSRSNGNRLRVTRGRGSVAGMFRLTALHTTLPFSSRPTPTSRLAA